jgi:hypothetical protein
MGVGVFALNSLVLYSSPYLPIGSGNFRPNLYLNKDPSNHLRLCFLPTSPMKLEQTECFEMSAHKIQTLRNHPERKNTILYFRLELYYRKRKCHSFGVKYISCILYCAEICNSTTCMISPRIYLVATFYYMSLPNSL